MTGVLGEKVAAPRVYSPDILEAIERAPARERLGIAERAGQGWDAWHLYELSWLEAGRPVSCCGVLSIPADSPATVESKSLKLYCNSLNFHDFASAEDAVACVERDLSALCGAPVTLTLTDADAIGGWTRPVAGESVDQAPLADNVAVGDTEIVEETLHSHLLRSLCPVTGQPDWATLEVAYRGARVNRSWLLALVLSFREHQDFHEQCVEQIFARVVDACHPKSLRVSAFYARRGGIDITPHRSLGPFDVTFDRLARQ